MGSSSSKHGRGRNRIIFVLVKNVKDFNRRGSWLRGRAVTGRQYV